MSEFARKPAESSHALHTVSGPSAGPAIELAREKHYAPWVKARQEQLAVNVRKSWTVLDAGNQTGKRKSPKRAKSA